MESTDLKSSNATTVKLSRASLVAAIDTWHRSVVFHASIVDTPSAKAISESLPKTPGRMLVPTEPTFTKLDLDEDGDPLFQRRSHDKRTEGFNILSVEGLLAYKKAVEEHKTRADKVVALDTAFMKTYVYGTVHEDLLIELGGLPAWNTVKSDPAAVVFALLKLLDTNKYDSLSTMVNLLMSLKEMPALPGDNSARTFVNAARQAVRAITNSLGSKDIAVDVLAATVLINGVSPDRAAFVSSLRATNVLESLKFEELGTKLIDEGARTLGSRDMDGSKALSASAPPLGKKPNDSADKDAPACPLCSLLSAKVPGLVVARANHPLTSCWMAREAERYFRSDRPHRSGKQQQHQQQQQQQSLDVSATAVRRPTSAQQQQAHGRRTVVADAVVASGSARSTMTTLSRDEYVQRRLAAEAEYDALAASATALSATGSRAGADTLDSDAAAHHRLDAALERCADDGPESVSDEQWRALFARGSVGPSAFVAAASPEAPATPFIWDSACTYSITYRLADLGPEAKLLRSPISISAAKGAAVMQATHVGRADFLPPTCNMILYVPSSNVRLLSLGYLHRSGGAFQGLAGSDSLRVVSKDGTLIDISPRSTNNTYPFSAASRRPAAVAAATVKIDGLPVFTKRQQSRNDAVMSIHCALNHPSAAKMKALLTTHPAYGLAASDVDSAFEESGPCPICLTKAPRFIGGDSRSPPPPLVGHTISMDLKAMPTPQIGGATVAIVFVCGLSKFCGVVGALSKNKAHLLEAVQSAIALSFTRYGLC